MDDSLPAKHITINSNPSYNRHACYKPWWTERLTILWELRCKAERERERHEHLRISRWETEVSRTSEAVRQGCKRRKKTILE